MRKSKYAFSWFRHLLALEACLCMVLPAFTQERRLELTEPFSTDVREVLPTEDGGFLLFRTRYVDYRVEPWEVIKVSAEFKIEWQRDLPRGDYDRVIPYQEGFLLRHSPLPWREGEERSRVIGRDPGHNLMWFRTPLDTQPQTVYSSEAPRGPGSFDVAASQTEIYLLEHIDRGPVYELRRLNEIGRIEWSYALGETGGTPRLTVTPDGPVIAYRTRDQLSGERDYVSRFVALSANGVVRWQRETSQGNFFDFSYVEPNTLTYFTGAQSPDEPTMTFLDSSNGRERTTISAPAEISSLSGRSIPNGRLYTARMFFHPYILAMSAEGTRMWSRRYRVLRTDGEHHVYPLGSDSLLLVAQSTRGLPRRSIFLGIDASASNLADDYTRCLDGDPLPIIEREKRIQRKYGIYLRFDNLNHGRDASGSYTVYDPCASPTEAQYQAFLEALSSELERLNAKPWLPRSVGLRLEVTQTDQPFRLAHYSFEHNCGVAGGPCSGYRYEVSPSGAAQIADYVMTRLKPAWEGYMEGLTQLGEKIGYPVFLDVPDDHSDLALLLQQLESAALAVLTEINTTTAAQQQWIEANRPRHTRYFLGPYGFGTERGELQPLNEARATFLAGLVADSAE